MNTKLVMTTSAVILGLAGIALTFAPQEIAGCFNLEMNKTLTLLMQILGSLYFAFGMLNWMVKTSLIGGIYNRPIAVANFSHFLIAGLALTKGLVSNHNLPKIIWMVGTIYIVFAVSFGIILFKHPVNEKKS